MIKWRIWYTRQEIMQSFWGRISRGRIWPRLIFFFWGILYQAHISEMGGVVFPGRIYAGKRRLPPMLRHWWRHIKNYVVRNENTWLFQWKKGLACCNQDGLLIPGKQTSLGFIVKCAIIILEKRPNQIRCVFVALIFSFFQDLILVETRHLIW